MYSYNSLLFYSLHIFTVTGQYLICLVTLYDVLHCGIDKIDEIKIRDCETVIQLWPEMIALVEVVKNKKLRVSALCIRFRVN